MRKTLLKRTENLSRSVGSILDIPSTLYGTRTCSGIQYFTQGIVQRHIAIPLEHVRPGACVLVHLVNELVKMEADLPQ